MPENTAWVLDWTRDVFDHAPLRIHVVDSHGKILYTNNFSKEAADGSAVTERSIFDYILPEDHELVWSLFSLAINNKVPGQVEVSFSFGQKIQRLQLLIIPLYGRNLHTGTLALLCHHPAPASPSQDALKKQMEMLEARLAERSKTLQEYARYIDAGKQLNIRLPRLTSTAMVLQALAEQVTQGMDATFCAIFKVEKDWIEYAAGVKAPVLHHRKESLDDEGALGQILQTNQVCFYQDFHGEDALRYWRRLPHEFSICSLIIAPIICLEGFRGILYLGFEEEIEFEKNEALILRAFVEAAIDSLNRIHVVQQLERNIRAREQEIAVLYDLSTYAQEPVDLDDLLHKSLRRIMSAVSCDTGLIYHGCAEEAQEELATCWPQTGIPQSIKAYLRESSPPKRAGMKSPYYILDLPPDYAYSCITVPVSGKAKPNCYLRLFGDPRAFHHSEVIHLILSAARQLGLSIDSAVDRKLAGEAILLEERQRLARNLHDSITQSLYALTLSGDVARKALDRNEDAKLRAALDDITNASLQALKEMRLMLFELRPAALENTGLLEALELRLNTVERRSGMEAALECAGELQIPDYLEVELYHIISEALNNSLRHSEARSVRVALRSAVNAVTVEVEDNGKGFDIASRLPGGLGLTSMSERVRKLGGNLTIFSSAGQGTRLNFKVRVQGEGYE